MSRGDGFGPEEAAALALDASDPLRHYRERFHLPPSPTHPDGRPAVYLCGNSLGLQPRAVAPAMQQELNDWAQLGVEGHFHARTPWLPYHETVRQSAARLVGALPEEVVAMNTLTVNLHLFMVSFYRPSAGRHRILLDAPCFPSDVYAAKSQLRFHGYDPEDGLVWLKPRPGEHTIRREDALDLLEREGDSIALVLLSGVNYFTGQFLDLGPLTAAAHSKGCTVGVDLAHAAGNVPLELHDWNVDFAAWCSYKYINSGPGAVAGGFVHARHLGQEGPDSFQAYRRLPRFEGWWGNDPEQRFEMKHEFVPVKSVDAWQLSNPPIFSLTPVKVSLELFDEVGMEQLRAKSVRLTAYLEYLIDEIDSSSFEIITPRDAAARGCQLSILVHEGPQELFQRLQQAGVICDLRRPNVIRVAPVPLYNSYHDCWSFAQVLARATAAS